jgi:hypothetical protein
VIVRGHQRVLMVLAEPAAPLLVKIAHYFPGSSGIAPLNQVPAHAAS